MRIHLAFAFVVTATASVAHAKDAVEITAAKQLLDAQVKAMAAGDGTAFAATFDDEAYLISPGLDEAASRSAIEPIVQEWLGAQGETAVKLDHAKFGRVPGANCAWISTEIVVPAHKKRYRVTELIAPHQKPTVDKPTIDDYRVLSAHISLPLDDKTALALAGRNELPPLPQIDGGTKPLGGETTNPETLSSPHLPVNADPAVTLIGSAPTEFFAGKSTVASKLKAWKSLAIKATSEVNVGDANSMNAAMATTYHVDVTFKVKGKPVVVPYRVQVILCSGAPYSGIKDTLCAVHFSIAQGGNPGTP